MPDPQTRPRRIETPCVRICVIHPLHGLCEGCGRTLAEIGRWSAFSAEERRRIMAELPGRLTEIASTS